MGLFLPTNSKSVPRLALFRYGRIVTRVLEAVRRANSLYFYIILATKFYDT